MLRTGRASIDFAAVLSKQQAAVHKINREGGREGSILHYSDPLKAAAAGEDRSEATSYGTSQEDDPASLGGLGSELPQSESMGCQRFQPASAQNARLDALTTSIMLCMCYLACMGGTRSMSIRAMELRLD